MGWQIHLIKNTVKVSKDIAIDILKTDTVFAQNAKYGYFDLDDGEEMPDLDNPNLIGQVMEKGKLRFDPDHLEHMDYLEDPEIRVVLTAHKVKGEVVFCSHDGDNAGQAWGYSFDGKGGCVCLAGKVKDIPLKPV